MFFKKILTYKTRWFESRLMWWFQPCNATVSDPLAQVIIIMDTQMNISFQTFALSIMSVLHGVAEKSGRLHCIPGHTQAKTYPIPTGHPISIVAVTLVSTFVILVNGMTLSVAVHSNSYVRSHCKYRRQHLWSTRNDLLSIEFF